MYPLIFIFQESLCNWVSCWGPRGHDDAIRTRVHTHVIEVDIACFK